MTDNHDYDTPDPGTADWHEPLNENFEALDRDVIVKGTHADRPDDPAEGTWYLSTDRRWLSHYDGSQWHAVGGLGTAEDPTPGTAHRERVDAARISGDLYAREYPGGSLSDRIRNALDDSTGQQTVRVTARDDGEAWAWGSTLDLHPTEHDGGIEIVVGNGVEIEYGGDGWAIHADGDANISAQVNGARLRIRGGIWRSTGANPAGWCRLVDVGGADVQPNVVYGFENGGGDAAMYEIATKKKWAEDNRIAGACHRTNVGARFVIGPNDNHSFVDTHVDNLHANTDLGLHLRGHFTGTVVDNFRWFPNSDGATGVLLDYRVNDVTFLNPRLDDAGDENAAITGFRTTENYANPSPILINPNFNRVETPVDRHDEIHDVFALDAQGNHVGFRDLGRGSAGMGRNGSWELRDADGDAIWRVGSDSNVHAGGNWQTGTPPTFVDGLSTSGADLSGTTGQRPQEVRHHDGSGDAPRGYYWWDEAAGTWVRFGGGTEIDPS